MDLNIALNFITVTLVVIGLGVGGWGYRKMAQARQTAADAEIEEARVKAAEKAAEGAERVAALLEAELHAVRERLNRVQDDLGEERKLAARQMEINQELSNRVGQLESLPDLSRILQVQAESAETNKGLAERIMTRLESPPAMSVELFERGMGRVVEAFEGFEQRAEERHERLLAAIHKLANGRTT